MFDLIVRVCRVCAITDADYRGEPVGFVEEDLCGACADAVIRPRTALDPAEEMHHRMAGMARVVECHSGS